MMSLSHIKEQVMQVEQRKDVPADKFVLRFDATGQRDALKKRAALNRRSLNAEILSLIDQALLAGATARPPVAD